MGINAPNILAEQFYRYECQREPKERHKHTVKKTNLVMLKLVPICIRDRQNPDPGFPDSVRIAEGNPGSENPDSGFSGCGRGNPDPGLENPSGSGFSGFRTSASEERGRTRKTRFRSKRQKTSVRV